MRAEPIVNGLEAEWSDSVQVIQIDIHRKENRPLINDLGVQFTPTFVILNQDGQEVWRSVGSIDAREAHAQVEALGAKQDRQS